MLIKVVFGSAKKKKERKKAESMAKAIYISSALQEKKKITGCWGVGVPDPQFLRSPARGGVPSPLRRLLEPGRYPEGAVGGHHKEAGL